MSHGITETDSLVLHKYSGWHNLGTVIEEVMSPSDAMSIANLDWTVGLTDGLTGVINGDVVNSDRACFLVREDNNDVLDVVGKDYSPMQIEQLFDLAWSMGDQVKVESAGSLFGGKKVFVTLKGESLGIKHDVVHKYLTLENTNGGAAAKGFFGSIRPVCSNTLDMAATAGFNTLKIQHSGNIVDKVEQAKKILQRYQKVSNIFDQRVVGLASKKIGLKDLQMFWKNTFEMLHGEPDTEEKQQEARHILDLWELTLETEMLQLSESEVSLWLASNAVTSQLQKDIPKRKKEGWEERTAYSNLAGDNSKETSKVFKKALDLV